MMEVRTMRSVSGQPAGSFTQHTDRFVIDDDDVNSDTDAESEMSLKSRSFLHSVNDRGAKDAGPFFKRCNPRQQQTFFHMENVYVRHWKHLHSWEELVRQLTFHQNMKEISL